MVWGCFSWLGLRYYIPDDSVRPTLWKQFGEGLFQFQHDNAPVHKARYMQKWFVEISVEGLGCRALTSTPSNIFGMNWNADCELGLIAQHQCPTSLMLLY